MLTRLLIVLPVAITLAGSPPRDGSSLPNKTVVHEWGTFTTVADLDGSAQVWAPFTGSDDLPCFVRRLGPAPYTKAGLARVRMETPVLYFYSPVRTSISVSVRFPSGLFTEWYPQATAVTPSPFVPGATPLGWMNSELSWRDVEIHPDASPELPVEPKANHYYAARNTDAAPIRVNGQWERLLFYRGIADFAAPINVRIEGEDGVVVAPLDKRMPPSLLFENRHGRAGIRVVDPADRRLTLPALDKDPAQVERAIQEQLVNAGLYPREAAAMVETWRDSWFAEGVRLLYIVPPALVDTELPLKLEPAPAELKRVFVGRVELFPPWVGRDLKAGIENDDPKCARRWGRFLSPIMWRYRDGMSDQPMGPRVKDELGRMAKPGTPCRD